MSVKGKDTKFDLINNIFMFVVLVIVVYPLYFVAIASISDPLLVNAGKVMFWPRGFMLNGYQRIFQESKILTGYYNSIRYTILGTSINVVLTISCGYALSNKHLKWKKPIMFFFLLTMFFNGGMIPKYLVVDNLGMINTIWAMVLPNALSVWNVIVTRTYFKSSLPEELFETASIDGSGVLRFFTFIVIPLSKPIIAVMVLFYAVAHWNAFFDALIYLESETLHPLQLVLRNILLISQMNVSDMMEDVRDIIERQKLSELMKYGIIIVSSIPMLVIYPFIQKYFIKGIMIGSLKG